MKIFELRRIVDESGVSGTGTVAQGVIFDSGWCVVAWMTEHRSVCFYTSIDEVVAIHGHGGKTRVVQIADVDPAKIRPLRANAWQDDAENICLAGKLPPDPGAIEPTEVYLYREREKFCALFDEIELTGSRSLNENADEVKKP